MSVARPDRRPAVDQSRTRPRSTPTALRIALGLQLRRLREGCGITTDAAAGAIRVSAARIGRIEMGRTQLSETDVSTLLTLYGVAEQQEREMFRALIHLSDDCGWWHRYRSTQPNWFEMSAVLEQAASVIRSYEPQFVPDLLQTEDSARTLIRSGHPTTFDKDVERRVAERMARQQVLARPGGPSLWAVLDEAALWRLGPPSTMRTQIAHLLELAALPNITVQLMPFGSRGHTPVGGPFTILRFAEPDLPDIVHLEHLTGALYLDEGHEVAHYAMVMDRACVQAKSPTETMRFLDRLGREI